jgi:hypothetical protein
VVRDLVRDHIGLVKVTPGTELLSQGVAKAQVDADLLVAGALLIRPSNSFKQRI